MGMDWGAGCLDEKRREAGSRRRRPEAEWNGMHTHARLVCAVSAAGAGAGARTGERGTDR